VIALTGFQLRRLRQHLARTLLALAALATGTALMVAVLALYGSLDASIRSYTQGVAGTADVEVAGITDSGFDEALLEDVAAVAGVKHAVPLVRTPVVIAGEHIVLVGLDERARALGLDVGRPPDAGIDGMFVGTGLAERGHLREGDRAVVAAGAEQRRTQVLGTVEDGDADRFNDGLFAVAALPVAQDLAAKSGRLDSILVVTAGGTEPDLVARRLAQVVSGRAVVDSPELRAEQAAATARPVRQATLVVAALVLFVGAFVVFNTMSMAALERRRELATLRALGGRRRALLLAFLLEAAVLGLVGAAVGAAAGTVLARALVDRLPEYIVSAFAIRIGFSMPSFTIPMAMALGVVAAVTAAVGPGRQAVGTSPVEAMRPEGVLETRDAGERISWVEVVIGVIAATAAVVVAVGVGGASALPTAAVLLLGAVVATHGIQPALATATAAVASRGQAAGRLAATSVTRAPRRTWATVIAVLVAAGAVVGEGGFSRNLVDSITENVEVLEETDLNVISSPDDVYGTDTLFPDAWKEQLEEIPGVASVSGYQFTFATFERDRVMLQGYAHDGNAAALADVPAARRAAVAAGRGVVISAQLAERHDLERGDRLTIPTPQGTRMLPVAAVTESFLWDRGLVVMALQSLQRWFARPGVSGFQIELERDANESDIRRSIGTVIRSARFPAEIHTGAEVVDSVQSATNQATALFTAMRTVIVGAAVLAVFNALLIAVIERRRELGVLRAIGASRRRLMRAVLIEGLAVGVVGALLGISLGLLWHWSELPALAEFSRFPLHYRFTLVPAAVAAALSVFSALAGSALPARRAGRINVVDAIGYE
jgi:putative ABC transport system permease protein